MLVSVRRVHYDDVMDQDPYIPPRPYGSASGESPLGQTKGCGTCLLWSAVIFLVAGFVVWWQVRSMFAGHLRQDVQATCMAVHNSFDQFRTEYDHLPAPRSAAVKGQDWDTNSSASENVITILKALDKKDNPNATDFLGDIKDAKTQDGKRLNGLVLTETTAALIDPWGHPYRIRLDGDGDGFVADPDPAIPGNRIASKAIVWSAGKDGDPETWSDNVGSWLSAQ